MTEVCSASSSSEGSRYRDWPLFKASQLECTASKDTTHELFIRYEQAAE